MNGLGLSLPPLVASGPFINSHAATPPPHCRSGHGHMKGDEGATAPPAFHRVVNRGDLRLKTCLFVVIVINEFEGESTPNSSIIVRTIILY